jgi:hypothetical protein
VLAQTSSYGLDAPLHIVYRRQSREVKASRAKSGGHSCPEWTDGEMQVRVSEYASTQVRSLGCSPDPSGLSPSSPLPPLRVRPRPAKSQQASMDLESERMSQPGAGDRQNGRGRSQPGAQFGLSRSLSAVAQIPLTRENDRRRTPSNTPSGSLGAEGRRFKSCHPDWLDHADQRRRGGRGGRLR